jgi:hypothetical protein
MLKIPLGKYVNWFNVGKEYDKTVEECKRFDEKYKFNILTDQFANNYDDCIIQSTPKDF